MNRKRIVLILVSAVLWVCGAQGISWAGDVDVNGDGVVNTADLELVDRAIGTTGEHAADVNDDNVVNIADLVLVKNAIGTTSAPDGMVLIPAGNFQMGSNDPEAWDDEQPVHTVYVGAFYMDKYEVTVGQYKAFIRSTGHRALPDWVSTYSPTDRHPVVGVSWHDAMAYAAWAGKRLPTEAEWEKAGRGGLAGEKYPWGDAAPNGTQCNFADQNLSENWDENWGTDWSDKNADDGYVYAAPVGSYPSNGYGLYDMAGNVWEWCLDAYNSNFYRNSPRLNPIAGAASISDVVNNYTNVKYSRVLRGGSWTYYAPYVRVAARFRRDPTYPLLNFGFRCARTVTP